MSPAQEIVGKRLCDEAQLQEEADGALAQALGKAAGVTNGEVVELTGGVKSGFAAKTQVHVEKLDAGDAVLRRECFRVTLPADPTREPPGTSTRGSPAPIVSLCMMIGLKITARNGRSHSAERRPTSVPGASSHEGRSPVSRDPAAGRPRRSGSGDGGCRRSSST